jgi:bifunctional NMN adenylyltransferase/nudix hydrolase
MRTENSVLIGRFQPPHQGHFNLIRQALENSERLILVLGSHHSARTLRNPFTAHEREQMIRACLTPEEQKRIQFVAVRDYFYQDEFWTAEVRSKVGQISGNGAIALLGNQKDFTSYYLNLFPEWNWIPAQNVSELNSTQMRIKLFCDSSPNFNHELPPSVVHWLKQNFIESEAHAQLCEEFQFINRYKESWSTAPYPPVFVTVDSVIVHTGHILLIRRKKAPGKGLLALPGGFLEPNERIGQAVIRELLEETSIDLTETALNEHLKSSHIFDHPLRSARGRTITHAYFFLFRGGVLPKIQADDDAAEVQWIPILDLPKFENQFFEDHFHIVNYFTRSY